MPGVKRAPSPPSVEQVCRGLSDPTRLRLLARLGRDEVCVCDLQSHVRRDQPTVSRHLAMLRRCGLVTCRKEGRWCHYRRAALPAVLRRIVDLAAPPADGRKRDSCC
jgi:ArsR family transcriptional regulator